MHCGKVDRFVPLAFAGRSIAKGCEDRSARLTAILQRERGADGVRQLRRDYRADRVKAQTPAGVVVRKLPPCRMIGGAREERQEHFIGREADSQRQSEVAIVGHEDVLAALEGHRGSGLHRLVPFARGCKRNLPLAIQLKAPVLEGALHEHRAEDRDELLVRQSVTLQGDLRLRFRLNGHCCSYSATCAKILRQAVAATALIERTGMLRFGVALAALSILFVQIADAGEQYAPATVSVAQLFALTRHAAGSLPRGAYHSVKRTQSAKGDVWTSESYWDGGDYQTTERLGNFVWANGSDGGRHWSEDANGLVTQSSNLFSEVDPFSIALRAPENPTGAVKLLGMTSGTPPQYVVE